MSDEGLAAAVARMRADDATDDAVATFSHFYRKLEAGDTGLIPEADIEPIGDLPALADVDVPPDVAAAAFARTAVIKLNGGLATSMGLDRAKSLVTAKDGLSFLDLIVAQVRQLRADHGVALPLIFMNSFRTRDDTLAALGAYPDIATDGLPLDFLQSREPKLAAADLSPVDWPADPSLQWCPPGHADIFPALRSSGLLDQLLDAGFTYAFCSNADNLGAVADPRIAGWIAANDVGFVLESTRRIPADRKGGHLAVRRSDGRLVLRETAQTAPQDQAALQDLSRHKFCNTNNLWVDLRVLKAMLEGGVLDLPLIRNVKNLDPQNSGTPEVIQIEAAMGSAVQVFDGARSILVERDRFIPVKTTNDLLVLRSDQYQRHADGRVTTSSARTTAADTFVDLDPHYYKLLADFEHRFPGDPPSLAGCDRLTVHGDVTFGDGVVVQGSVVVDAADLSDGGPVADGAGTRLPAGTVLRGSA